MRVRARVKLWFGFKSVKFRVIASSEELGLEFELDELRAGAWVRVRVSNRAGGGGPCWGSF